MKYEEYITIKNRLERAFNSNIFDLNKQYAHSLAKFKVGDFIYNTTGIIRVKEIRFETDEDNQVYRIVYRGTRYYKKKGKLIKTKDQTHNRLYDYYSSTIKKLDTSKWKTIDI
jgi:hypothetical protein